MIGAVYKDIKPRVDTRWKKSEVPVTKIATKPTATTTITSVVKKPLAVSSESNSKDNGMGSVNIFFSSFSLDYKYKGQPSKPDGLKNTISDSVTVQIKKSVTQTAVIDTKKETKLTTLTQTISYGSEMQLIRSPGKVLMREKVENVQRNFYESHSSKLLHQIDNIDEKDRLNPQLLSEYVNDIYAYLFKLEDHFPIHENFLANQMDVTPKMRSVLLDWINEVHSQFSLELETYHMAVSMIDRYLQETPSTSRRYLQLVGVTALFMASKYEELMPPDITDFVYVTDDTYSKEQILEMEKNVFKALGFHLGKPLPIHFLRRFAKAAGTLGDRQYMAAKYFIELTSIDYELTKSKPSEVSKF